MTRARVTPGIVWPSGRYPEEMPVSEIPLCKTASCAELGIRAVDRWGFCRDCKDAREEDAADARAEAARETRRWGDE